ncbi:MAG: HRDC domain-containing protein [Thermoguttaceae bacterium]|nr:HRDC domain-containing protein [Thermoguttaceae bacterium]MDW8037443.1 HRDC domain-containing protein [Thermoguttaceae bacterium]
MDYLFVQTPEQLQHWCEQVRSSRTIALDTEFIGDLNYRPELCLVQVEVEGQLALLDALVLNLNPFWELVASGDREIIVHGGSRDMLFCYQAIGKMPRQLVDVQIAAALIGLEYPAGFSTLMERLLGRVFSKTETRTDWRHRPLSAQQIQYALEDVRYLRELWGVLRERLVQLDRLDWLYEEMEHWKSQVLKKAHQEGWRRLPGQSGLSRRALGILRELWQWREQQAQRRNCPARFVLRDDLLVELARRETANIHRIRAVRGMQHPSLRPHLPQIAACIQRALHLREEHLPEPISATSPSVSPILTQFLYAVLAARSRQVQVAPSLVGTPNDLRDWIAYRLGLSSPSEIPVLERGWRKQLLGPLLENLLTGQLAVRIHNPTDDLPLQTLWVSNPPISSPPLQGQSVPAVSHTTFLPATFIDQSSIEQVPPASEPAPCPAQEPTPPPAPS